MSTAEDYTKDFTQIWLERETLSDGSEVYCVTVGDIGFQAVTAADAVQLAEGFASLIQKHTNEICEVIHGC